MDTNNDELLTQEEFVEGRTVREKPLLMKRFDLTEEQYQEKRDGYRGNYLKDFIRRDADRNGVLNADELL